MAVSTEEDLSTILQFLPACIHCRSTKRRCDTNLPACLNCSKAGEQCKFLDHPSGEVVNREYIATLLGRLRSLKKAAADPYAGQASQEQTPECRPLERRAIVLPALKLQMTVFDQAMHEFLIAWYLEHVHQLFPILSSDDFCLQKNQPATTELGPRGLFVLYMVYSIACHTLPGNDSRMVLLSDAAFDAAKVSLGAVTERADAEALQAVCLLSLRSLFEPRTGNLSQQLAFAQRLLVEVKVRGFRIAGPDHQDFATTLFCLGMQYAAAHSKNPAFLQPPSVSRATLPDAAEQLHDQCVLQWKFLTCPESAIQDPRLPPDQTAPPLLLAIHAETSFLMKPCERSALSLLSLYMREDMVFNVFTQQWVSRAAMWLFSNSRRETQQEGLHMAMRILDRCALKWSNARALQEALQNPMGGG